MPDPYELVMIRTKSSAVTGQAEVRIVPQQHRGKEPSLVCDRLMSVSLAPLDYALERAGKPAPRRLALDHQRSLA